MKELDKEITDKCLIITDISFIGEKPVFGDLLAMIGIEDSKFPMKNENFLKLADLGIEQSDDFLLFQMKIMILVMILFCGSYRLLRKQKCGIIPDHMTD